MQMNKRLTPYNHNEGTADRIKYIVIHYVGATGGAKANCQWYARADRRASAHYYVDFDGSVWQSVEDNNIAWHCGAKKYVHPECRNANSIGIEMCVRNKGSKSDTSIRSLWTYIEGMDGLSLHFTATNSSDLAAWARFGTSTL